MDGTKELVVVMTHGAEHELSSVGFTIANGGMTAGFKVYAFLTSAAVDLVRKKAVDQTHVAPLEPLKALIDDFLRRGGTIWACPPCVKARGYQQEDFIEGVKVVGASAMHERLLAGATALSF
ncbi:MAG: DsrE family protein [Deltaproteobacteria bacterium]|nr:DsrE family protein [Deltaproteobacteria bacterium]